MKLLNLYIKCQPWLYLVGFFLDIYWHISRFVEQAILIPCQNYVMATRKCVAQNEC